MPPKSKVDLYAAIRRDARAGLSNRALQRKYGVGFRTVRAAMTSVWPEPRKQRHTVKRIFDRLLDEHGAVEVTYPMVRAYVAVRRPQIRIEAGRGPLNAFIPQTHMPGTEAEVDFGDVTIRLAGEQVKVYLFSMRLSYSGKGGAPPLPPARRSPAGPPVTDHHGR